MKETIIYLICIFYNVFFYNVVIDIIICIMQYMKEKIICLNNRFLLCI